MRRILLLSLFAVVLGLSIWSSNAYAFAIEISAANGKTTCSEISGTWDNTTNTCSTGGFNLSYGDNLQIDPGVILSISFSRPNFGQILAQEGLNITNQGIINFTKDGTLVLSPHDFLNNTGTINFYNNGELDYAGTVENRGTMNFYGACDSPCINNANLNDVFTNIGKVNFYGSTSTKTIDIQNTGIFNNTQLETNIGRFVGNLTLNNGGSIDNSGTFENDFDIYVVNNGNITNQGTFDGVGYIDFSNMGNLNNEAGKTFVIKHVVNAHNVFNHGIMNITSSSSSSLLIAGNLTNYDDGTINIGGFIGLNSGSSYLLNYGTINSVPNAPGFGASGEIIDAGPTVLNYCGGKLVGVGINPYPVNDACDTLHPITTAMLSGAAGTNGWYRSPVSVTLTATDNPVGSSGIGGNYGSGVKSTSYSLDGGPQTTYTSPFTVTGDANHTLTFNSTDNAGNMEEENILHIAIDTTPPTLAVQSPANGTIVKTVAVSVSGTSSDDIDVASISWKLDSGPIYTATGTTNWFFTTGALSPGAHTISVNATDEAGNVARSFVSITYAAPTLTLAPPAGGTTPITFSANAGGFTGLESIQSSSLPTPPPPGRYPLGFFSWNVTGFAPAASVTVTVTSPTDLHHQSNYFKLIGNEWIPVPVKVSGNNMTFTISDNGPYDDNPAVGVISDPAAIADPTSGRVTGGGNIGKGTDFGFEVHSNLDKANPIHGVFEYHDQIARLHLESNNITFLSVDPTISQATFVGTGTYDRHDRHDIHGTAGTFLISISDPDKTGDHDTFSITVTNSTGYAVYQNSGAVKGHIEIKNQDVDDANTIVGAVTVGNTPEMLAFDRDNGKIYVANNADGTVSVIDGRTGAVSSTIAVGNGPQGVAFDDRNDRIYVANTGTSFGGNSVSVIDAKTGGVTGKITVGAGPIGIAFDGKNDRLYVVNTNSHSVSVIDPRTDTVNATVPVGTGPNSVAVDERDNKIYVTNFFDGTVSVIDGSTNTVSSTIKVGTEPIDVAFDKKNGGVYVANFGDNTVSVIDSDKDTISGTVLVGSGPIGVTIDDRNDNIYVGDSSSDIVSVIDGSSNTVVESISGLASPARGTVDTENDNVYIGNIGSDTVTVISTKNSNGNGY